MTIQCAVPSLCVAGHLEDAVVLLFRWGSEAPSHCPELPGDLPALLHLARKLKASARNRHCNSSCSFCFSRSADEHHGFYSGGHQPCCSPEACCHPHGQERWRACGLGWYRWGFAALHQFFSHLGPSTQIVGCQQALGLKQRSVRDFAPSPSHLCTALWLLNVIFMPGYKCWMLPVLLRQRAAVRTTADKNGACHGGERKAVWAITVLRKHCWKMHNPTWHLRALATEQSTVKENNRILKVYFHICVLTHPVRTVQELE